MKEFLRRFLAPEGKYKASGLFSIPHICLLILTVYLITEALNHTLLLSFSQIRNIIRGCSIVLCSLEILKIIFKVKKEHQTSGYDSWIPLYFCSITMYASLLSGFATGYFQHIGDVFLAVGALIGGICFLLYPSSSIMIYPWNHFLTLHSFFYHGVLTYLGILVNRSGLVVLVWKDILIYALYFGLFCFFADRINHRKGTNLMFISSPFFGTFLEKLYQILGKYYTFVLVMVQAIVPFIVVMWFRNNTTLLVRPYWYPPV